VDVPVVVRSQAYGGRRLRGGGGGESELSAARRQGCCAAFPAFSFVPDRPVSLPLAAARLHRLLHCAMLRGTIV
jgi:hypothetical protein